MSDVLMTDFDFTKSFNNIGNNPTYSGGINFGTKSTNENMSGYYNTEENGIQVRYFNGSDTYDARFTLVLWAGGGSSVPSAIDVHIISKGLPIISSEVYFKVCPNNLYSTINSLDTTSIEALHQEFSKKITIPNIDNTDGYSSFDIPESCLDPNTEHTIIISCRTLTENNTNFNYCRVKIDSYIVTDWVKYSEYRGGIISGLKFFAQIIGSKYFKVDTQSSVKRVTTYMVSNEMDTDPITPILPDLTAYITASRNPVTINVPALSTSELTCHVDGIADRDNDRYKKYLGHDWGELDFSVFPPKLICTDGNILAPTTDEVGGHGGSVFVDDSGDNVFKVKELYCKDYRQTQSIFLSRSENNTGISIEYDFKVNNLSTLTSPNTKNSCVLYTTGSMTYYYTRSLYLHLLDNGKYIINSSNTASTADDYYSSEELDIDFFDWVHVEVLQIYINYLSSVIYLKINGVLIPFIGSGANEDGSSKKGYTYWYYSFSAYTNWYGNEEICLKNYKIKTLTLNPDYEEYPELTYLWDTGETTKQITVQPTEPTTYSCTVTQGSRTANASILIDAIESKKKPIAVISPQGKPYIEHMIGKFYATNSYDINDPVSPIVKYIWDGVESVTPIFTTRVKKTDIITLQVVNALGEISEPVQVDLSQEYDQWGNKYKFLDIPMFLVCSKGSSLYDTLISRFPIPTNANDLYTSRYDTEYPKYTRIGFTTDISTDTITYMACLPQYGVAEYKAPREQVDIYPLGISWLEKRNMLKYFDKTKNSKGSLLTCIGHPELGEEGYGSLEWVLNSLGILTPKERYSIPRLLDLLELLLMDYENGGLIKL